MNFINNDEIVGRALFEPQWDDSVKRPSPGAFTRNNTSVTRHTFLTQEDLIEILKKDVENEKVTVKAVGLIHVSTIKDIGDPSKIFFEVSEMPTVNNPHHGEILPFEDEEKRKIKSAVPRGVSRKIGEALEILTLTVSGDVIDRLPPQ